MVTGWKWKVKFAVCKRLGQFPNSWPSDGNSETSRLNERYALLWSDRVNSIPAYIHPSRMGPFHSVSKSLNHIDGYHLL